MKPEAFEYCKRYHQKLLDFHNAGVNTFTMGELSGELTTANLIENGRIIETCCTAPMNNSLRALANQYIQHLKDNNL